MPAKRRSASRSSPAQAPVAKRPATMCGVTGKEAFVQSYTLHDGAKMPALGLGTYRMRSGQEIYNAVMTALQMGYRLIDTAALYKNEGDVGRACRDSGIPRSQIFVISKLWDSDHGYEKTLVAGKRSVQELGLDYIDLYLMHSPGLYSSGGGKIVETWDAMLQLKKEGLFRSIGVANFGMQHLAALEKYHRPLPTVNQLEMHPMISEDRAPLVKYCKTKGILVQAYGSVFSGHQNLLQKVSSIARAHGKTSAQVLLRWALQQQFAVIPKSVHKERQFENMKVFDFSLSSSDVAKLNSNASGRLPDYWKKGDPTTMKVDIGDAK